MKAANLLNGMAQVEGWSCPETKETSQPVIAGQAAEIAEAALAQLKVGSESFGDRHRSAPCAGNG